MTAPMTRRAPRSDIAGFSRARSARNSNGAMERNLRLVTGLTLFVYAASHFVGHATGLFGLAVMDSVGANIILAPWQTMVGRAVLLLSLLIHAALGLRALYRRRHFKAPALEAWQLGLGLLIPLLLVPHIVDVRVGNTFYGLDDSYYRVLYRIWIAKAATALPQQFVLLALVWAHSCIGLNFWLRRREWFQRARYFLLAGAVAMPFLAALGIVNAGWDEAMSARLQPGFADAHAPAPAGSPLGAAQATLGEWALRLQVGYGALVLFVLLARAARNRRERGRLSVRITYPGGRIVAAPPGFSVLEASRWAGIAHASACGGRGRCSTCRVEILAGAENAPARSAAESETLLRVRAPSTVRLACQLRPTGDITVAPLLAVGDQARDVRIADGESHERLVTALFIDLRDSTSFAAGRLPFDALFVIDRYVQRASAAIEAHGGEVTSVAGDGIMSLFGARSEPLSAARDALRAVGAVWDAIDGISRDLAGELERPLAFGVGVHASLAAVWAAEMFGRSSLQFLGEAGNVAARLEAATKDLKCVCIVSEAVFNVAGAIVPTGLAREELAIRGLDSATFHVAVLRTREEANFENAVAPVGRGEA
jgi:adenylate cyclase